MVRMLGDPQTRRTMGEAAAKKATKRFGLQAMTEAYEDLYRTALANARHLP
jgi:glycosyltransferase involved in cell wall biosynthesis